jgi:hypothetical protein
MIDALHRRTLATLALAVTALAALACSSAPKASRSGQGGDPTDDSAWTSGSSTSSSGNGGASSAASSTSSGTGGAGGGADGPTGSPGLGQRCSTEGNLCDNPAECYGCNFAIAGMCAIECTDDSQCSFPGPGTGACVHDTDLPCIDGAANYDRHICVIRCGAKSACPAGFSCHGVDGIGALCLPMDDAGAGGSGTGCGGTSCNVDCSQFGLSCCGSCCC